jgi:excisionase family DNA binding protein
VNTKVRIIKVCKSCGREFEARTTVTATCSDPCAKRYYKEKKRNDKIAQAGLKMEIQRKPEQFITEDQIRVIQAKEFLNLKEAALLLNVSPLTLRRWVLAGKVVSMKVGRKHLFSKRDLFVHNGKINII